MKTENEEKQGVLVVRILEDEINVDNANDLAAYFDQVLSHGHTRVVVNLQQVRFMDSSGIAVLIDLVNRLNQKQGVLRTCRVNRQVKGLFEVTKTHTLMNIHATEDEALSGIEN